MKWFKHDSDAHRDTKLKKLRMKYGIEGFGLYWYCIELIADSVNEKNITFELEDDAEIIAHDLGLHHERIQEMMGYMVRLGLFELSGNTITCMKLANRLDQSMTSNPQMRKIIAGIKQNHDPVMTKSECNHDPVMTRLDKTRLDKKINNKTSSAIASRFHDFWDAYPLKKNKKKAQATWKSRKLDAIADTLIADIKNRQANDRQWKEGFIPLPTTYLNGDRWEDEIDTGVPSNEKSGRNSSGYKSSAERTSDKLDELANERGVDISSIRSA